MGKTHRRLPIVERDEWLRPVESGAEPALPPLRGKNGRDTPCVGLDRRLRQRLLLLRLAARPRPRRLVVPRVAARRAGRLPLRRLQRLAAHAAAAPTRLRGVWSIFLPDAMYAGRLVHGSLYKLRVHGADGSWRDRIPAYAARVVQDDETKTSRPSSGSRSPSTGRATRSTSPATALR